LLVKGLKSWEMRGRKRRELGVLVKSSVAECIEESHQKSREFSKNFCFQEVNGNFLVHVGGIYVEPSKKKLGGVRW